MSMESGLMGGVPIGGLREDFQCDLTCPRPAFYGVQGDVTSSLWAKVVVWVCYPASGLSTLAFAEGRQYKITVEIYTRYKLIKGTN
jgi:hypothetical protein